MSALFAVLSLLALLGAEAGAAGGANEDGDLARVPPAAVGAPAAAEDGDLARIPGGEPRSTAPSAVMPAPVVSPPAPRKTGRTRLYLEDALTLAKRREPVVAFPPPTPNRWQNRISGDVVTDWSVHRSLKLVLSDRLDLVEEEDAAWWSRTTVRNELREAYASWQPRARAYLEAGRINVRNGVALGFNPIDVFRARTLVGQASLDPSVLSRNRLGTLMVRGQLIGERGALSLIYAPKLFAPSPVAGEAIGVDPRFDATNAGHRVLASASGNAGDLSVQAVAYFEPRRSKVGVALTRPIGSSLVAYSEAALGREANLIARALDYGRQTMTLPNGPPPLLTDPALAWRADVAAGAAWAIGTWLTLNLEYHYHEGALSGDDWRRWFAAGRDNPALAPELWYIRGYAADQMEPASRHNAFVRLAWPNAGIDELELDSFAFVNLGDGSVLTQTSAIYAISDRWTFTLSATGNLGSASSERGSLPQAASVIADLVLYL